MHTLVFLISPRTQFPMSRSAAYPVSSSNEPLDVLIVGGGLCGLAAAIATAVSGHRATVFEAFNDIHSFGSGVQLSPNGTRLLSKWGLGDILDDVLTNPRALQIRDLSGKILASRSENSEEMLRRYRSLTWTFHRVDLQRGLTRKATELGVRIQYSSRIVDIDSTNTTITFMNGKNRSGDLLVITDGTWSTLRRKVVGQDILPRTVGYTAYRMTADRRQVQDREVLDLMSNAQSLLWTGRDSYVHCFPMRKGTELSVLLITTTNASTANKSATSSDVEELQKLAEGWDPT